jgi:hypothetical protein
MTREISNLLMLDLDPFLNDNYIFKDFDIGHEPDAIIIKKENKEKFIEAFLKKIKEMIETNLHEYNKVL